MAAGTKEEGKYDASSLIEGQFEPGSRGRVLRNLLGIKRKREMDQVEARELRRALDELIRTYDQQHRFTPCRFPSSAEVVKAIALVHTELMLIHPFREGNGRVGRLLAVLMGLQGGLPPLDFGNIKGRKRQEYFAAVRAGMDRDYEPMEKVFSDVIGRTLGARARQAVR
ncbi:MAG: Fic family protein [Deltaproteobacteria bacterium]|nr:Fic family protein [Deltaproteobacteria bacterium]